MHRQHIEHHEKQMLRGTHIIHNLTRPLSKRLESRKHSGPYYGKPAYAGIDKYRSFYLGSDFMPELRWEWADEVVRLNHTGWYCDNYQDETIRGIVLRLPHNRGFLAGWSMGEGMMSEIELDIYPDQESAAYAADSSAEYAAERQREHEEANQEEE
jgi:hypothetical protein